MKKIHLVFVFFISLLGNISVVGASPQYSFRRLYFETSAMENVVGWYTVTCNGSITMAGIETNYSEIEPYSIIYCSVKVK
ncbi:hypothetical protein [Gallaecimonas mangrovi]|uniref:hypothetical protein n=1 Tax=Gallaecimonas mangrovi TaxID=2291597 RepID=UPI001260107C|nr:hypothetical protein [Gallaecimonas mangrovi]